MNDSQPSKRGEWRERLSSYKEKLLGAVVLGVPLVLIQDVTRRVSDRILEQPWQAIVFLIPVAAVVAVLAWRIGKGRRLIIDRRFLVVLGAYVLLFSVAAQTSFLDWSRMPTPGAQDGERIGLKPVSWGDWRYALVPKVSGDELIVVLREPTAGKTREEARAELLGLIGAAAGQGARGLALDYYFDGESGVDLALCSSIGEVGIPVFVGYTFERFQGRLNRLPLPVSLRSCVPPGNQGHLMGLLDNDRVARHTPLFFRGNPELPAISLLVARALSRDGAPPLPGDGLLRFVEPAEPPLLVRFSDLESDASALNSLRDRFVLVGEESPADAFDTPFGRKPGVMVHADAAHSLLHTRYFERPPGWVSLLLILACCYVLAAWCADGASLGKLLLLCCGLTAGFTVIAVSAVFVGPYWFSVLYPAAAVWLLLPVLLVLRRAAAPGPYRTNQPMPGNSTTFQ